MKQKLVNNAILNVLFGLTNAFLGFLLLPYMTTKLGLLNYGLYTLVMLFSNSSYAQILDFGLQSAVTKFTAQFHARNELQKIKVLLSTVFINFIAVASITFTIGFFCRDSIINILNIPNDKHEIMSICLTFAFMSFFFTLPNLALIGVLQGYRNFPELRAAEFATNSLRTLLIFGSLIFSDSLEMLLLINLIMAALALLINLILVYLYCDKSYPTPKNFAWSIVQEIRTLTLWVFIGRFCSTLFKQVDRILISILLGPIAVAEYEIFTKVPYVLKSIFGQVNEIVMPASSYIFETADREIRLQKLFYKSLRWQMFISLPIYFALICYSREFLTAWAGPQAAHLSWPFILTVIMSMTLVFMGGASMLLGINVRLKEVTLLAILASTANLIATYYFLKTFGVSGAIYGSLVGILLQMPLYFYYFAREFKISIYQILREYSLYLTIGTAGLVLKMNMLDTLQIDNPVILFLSSTVMLLSLYVISFFAILDSDDRAMISNLKNRILPSA